MEQTEGALAFLEAQAPTHYEYVNQYIGKILCLESGSGMKVKWDPPTAKIGARTRGASELWYAGFLVHEACRSAQYHDYLTEHGTARVPHDVYTGRDAEWECLQIQAAALEKMGAGARYVKDVLDSIESEYWKVPSGGRDY